MNTKIELVQHPVIKHQLAQVGKSVTARLNDLNIEDLVATADTIQSLKTLRADLNKEWKDFEDQRKVLKGAITKPYTEFETTYKEEVSEKYKSAVDTLKGKIGDFELKVRNEKQANIERYFVELCANEGTEFLKFKDAGITVNLSTSEKKYKEECNKFVSRISDDLILIQGQEYAAEIITLYKTNGFNASKAITDVLTRKEQEKLEAERIKQARTDKRCDMLRGLSMVSHQMTNTFNYVQDENIFLEMKDVENLPDEDFQKRFIGIESKIKAHQEANKPKATQEPEQQEEPVIEGKPVSTQAATVNTAQPLKAPTTTAKREVVAPAKTFKASFECTGTMSQLKALGQYMKDNGITYKNM